MSDRAMSSPESKRAKGLRSPRTSKRRLTPDQDVKDVSYGDPTAQGLSQLSDLVSMETQPASLSTSGMRTAAPDIQGDAAEGLSQPVLTQDLTAPPELPSQPDIPPPELPSPALLYTHAPNGAAPPQQSPSLGGALGSFLVPYPGTMEQPVAMLRQPQEQNDHGASDAAAQRSKAARRGPMDEMRQLVRILVKIIPHSSGFLASAEEGGGGNRISEERIKYFLDSTLGDAPRPTWGVPQGWGVYLSELFTWVLERPISKDQAMRCAKREPGRSWEAIGSELRRLGIHSSVWPLPLTREGLRKAAKDPIPQPLPNASKRPAEETKGLPSKRRGHTSGGGDIESMAEVEIWQQIIRLLQAARRKLGSAQAADSGAARTGPLRAEAQALMSELSAVGSMGLQGTFALPVMVGPNGQLQFVQHFPVASAASPPQQPQQLSWPMMPSGSGPSGVSQLSSPTLNVASQLSGMTPSQLLLSQPLSTGSAFQPIRAFTSQQHGDGPKAQNGPTEGDSSRAHEVTRPQAIRFQPGSSAAANDEAMETEPPSCAPQSHAHDMSLPSTQDSERLYERLHVSLPEANTDMDIQWLESSQKGSKGSSAAVIRPQPMKLDQASGNPIEAAGVSFQPVKSSSSIVPFRTSAAPSSSLIPVSGALTGPYMPASTALIVHASGLQAATADGALARLQHPGITPSSTLPAQLSRFAPEPASAAVAVSSPAVWAPSLSAALR